METLGKSLKLHHFWKVYMMMFAFKIYFLEGQIENLKSLKMQMFSQNEKDSFAKRSNSSAQ
jgi:hypothetical protein